MKNKLIYLLAMLFLASCSKDSSTGSNSSIGSNNGSSGQGGSLARFAINGNSLYVLSQNHLLTYDISSPAAPNKVSDVASFGSAPETIFPFDSLLFLGSAEGMYIYDLKNAQKPVFIVLERHIMACDPVVAQGKYAYVTLHSENRCGRYTNELQIYDISNPSEVVFVKSYAMTKPYGLGIHNGKLFVCDNGLKYFDAADVHNLQLKQTFSISANDVIPRNNTLIVTAPDGIYQYDFSDPNGPLTQLSKISITPTL